MTNSGAETYDDLLDIDHLAGWMDDEDLGRGQPLEGLVRLQGGSQNNIFRFTRGDREYVLRRPPKHLRDNSNETMVREARVLAALAGTDVPHPGFIAACADTDVIGVAFYLMEPIDGFTPTGQLPEPYASDAAFRRRMGFELVDAAAKLGSVDYLEVGLEGFGKPDGWVERQVGRSAAYIQNLFASLEVAHFDGLLAPAFIPIEAQQMVQQVVTRRDRREHLRV